MKRITALAIFLALCSVASAQTSSDEETSSGADLTIIPRAGVTYDGVSGTGFGTSALYTLFEGNIGSNLSFSVCNHWLSDDPGALYGNTWRSDDCSWVDWATLAYTLGNFTLSAGKQVIIAGTQEIYANDYDSHAELSSQLWNNYMVYQWGGDLSWTNASETLTIGGQYTASPFSERPFQDGLCAAALYGDLELDNLSLLAAANMVETPEDGFVRMAGAGAIWTSGSFGLGLDLSARALDVNREGSALGTLAFSPSDKFDFCIKGGIERRWSDDRDGSCDIFGYGEDWKEESGFTPYGLEFCRNYVFGGAVANWYPLKDSRDLRVHAVAATNNYSGGFSFGLGLTYFLNLHFGK